MFTYRAKVTHVVDGDTIDLDIDLGFSIIMLKQRVRLLGIDAPESRTRDLVEKKHGMLAKKFVQDKCPVGKIVTVTTSLDKTGKYGRILGTILVDDLNLNESLVENNLAVRYHGQSKKDIQEAHLANRIILSGS